MPIPKKTLKQILNDPWYKTCCYPNCMRPAELEHALYYAGKKIQDKFAIIPVCANHHRLDNNGKPVDKRYHEYIAIKRMTGADRAKYSRVDWEQKLKHLKSIYGTHRRNTTKF